MPGHGASASQHKLTNMVVGLNFSEKPQRSNTSGFVVVGAGLPRTGTMSLRSALGRLLDGACYHMMFNVVMGTKEDWDFWDKALRGEVTGKDWVRFLRDRGFRSGVDYPISMFYRKLMDAFPEAKVILTIRDPEKWYFSVKNSILKAKHLVRNCSSALLLRIVGAYAPVALSVRVGTAVTPGFDKGMLDAVETGKDESVAFFNQWVEEVKQTVPKDRLLVFDVKQGWKPLGDFLGLPIPEEPFPNVNDTKTMRSLFARVRVISYLLVYVFPLSLLPLLALLCIF